MQEEKNSQSVPPLVKVLSRVGLCAFSAGFLDIIFLLRHSSEEDGPVWKFFVLTLSIAAISALIVELIWGLIKTVVNMKSSAESIAARLVSLALSLLIIELMYFLSLDFFKAVFDCKACSAGVLLLLLLFGMAIMSQFSKAFDRILADQRMGTARIFWFPLVVTIIAGFGISLYLIGAFLNVTGFLRNLSAYFPLTAVVIFLVIFAIVLEKEFEKKPKPLVVLSIAGVVAIISIPVAATIVSSLPESAVCFVKNNTIIAGGVVSEASCNGNGAQKAENADKENVVDKSLENTKDNLSNIVIITFSGMSNYSAILDKKSVENHKTLDASKYLFSSLLERGAFLFEHAYTPSSAQPKGLGALFSSELPSSVKWVSGVERFPVLAADNDTIAESFADAGYATAIFGSEPFLYPQYGFVQGFGEWRFFSSEPKYYKSLLAPFSAFVDYQLEAGTPFFAWIHIGDLSAGDEEKPKKIEPCDVFQKESEKAACKNGVSFEKLEAAQKTIAEITNYLFGASGGKKSKAYFDNTLVAIAGLGYPVPSSQNKNLSPESLGLSEYSISVPFAVYFPNQSSEHPCEKRVAVLGLRKLLFESVLKNNTKITASCETIGSILGQGPFVVEIDEEALPHSFALFDGDWKLIYKIDDNKAELYNLAPDARGEMDIAKERPVRLSQLKAEMARYLTEMAEKGR